MTRILTALLTAVVLLATAGAAAAKPNATFTIRGAGFGHGVGMSQYGALGYAQHGWTAPAILAHYYTGTALGATDPGRTVRVLLATGSSARITGAAQAGARALDPSRVYVADRAGAGQVMLRSGSRRVATFTAPLQIAGAGGVVGVVGHGSYRGALEISPGSSSGVTVVNAVSLEDYVQGVVPVESPSSWPLEALKAQAIAARTYAITTSRGGTFDQYADTRSQVYGGASVETPATNEAVAETRGQVVTYQGQPVTTYFFSTSGGRTENVENSFSGAAPAPWLESVADPYDGVSPRHRWSFTMSVAQAARKLHGLVLGRFRGIRVVRRGVSPRIVSAVVLGTRGSVPVDGATLRARLGLFDTWASFRTITSRRVVGDPTGGTRASLAGKVLPAGRGTPIVLQERAGGTWRPAGRAALRAGGAYTMAVPHAGLFRVVAGGGVGPAVRVGLGAGGVARVQARQRLGHADWLAVTAFTLEGQL
jgi:stage II sporulation protein D